MELTYSKGLSPKGGLLHASPSTYPPPTQGQLLIGDHGLALPVFVFHIKMSSFIMSGILCSRVSVRFPPLCSHDPFVFGAVLYFTVRTHHSGLTLSPVDGYAGYLQVWLLRPSLLHLWWTQARISFQCRLRRQILILKSYSHSWKQAQQEDLSYVSLR